MEKQAILLKEWEQRYGAYREFQAQYLTGLSISFSVWFLAVGYIFVSSPDRFSKLIILALLNIIVFCLIIAHRVVYIAIKKLGQRINSLEEQIGIDKFQTTQPLETGLRVSSIGFCINQLITLILFFYVLIAK